MRFPDEIIRRRQGIGSFNNYGEFEPGIVAETTLMASVQPISKEDDPTEGGQQFTDKLKAYVPVEDALLGGFEDREADKVIIDTLVYVVESSQSWRNHHTKAILIREP